ncbi:hypothetical protein SPBR_02192 [Sporothrix brasiliensis 5110]|uniref:Uncharacterized protein n=1 Tax=Sporothrix brasiliensis 5110 TaxID=1398154 RepID=A0A0C2FQ83_9PEZI|nr:uncharacterized protein SPBR_02192 [Sporothrix brasiliensis 5110]KIH93178.1 hypothetical protein SPBR_02192 [Sporothrix brasiliensis 5110]
MARYSMYSEQFSRDRSSVAPGSHRSRSASVDRPYRPSHASFSTPRPSPATFTHSATPSTESSVSNGTSSTTTTSSLSPSNSASQLGSRKTSSKDRKPRRDTRNLGGAKLTASSLAQLKDLESNGGGPRRGSKRPGLIDVPLPWRPYYLQRKILSAFFAVFAACIIVAEALLDYSGRNAGLLGETSTSLRYLLSLVPPAVLTLIATLWSRVEYQAKMSAPWLQLAKGPNSADKTLLLDYFSILPPRDAFQALKNGDVAVACASMIAVLLKTAIIISTGMISLTVLSNTEQTTSVTLTSEFVNDGSRLSTIGNIPLLTMVGLQRDNLTFPDGTSSKFAFQEFASHMSSSTQFQATVSGFSGSINCAPAQLTLNGIQSPRTGVVRFNTTLTAEACTVNVPIISSSFSGNNGSTSRTHVVARMAHAACDNSSDMSAQRVVVFFGTASIDAKAAIGGNNQTVNGSIDDSQQLICRPSYAISQVDVVKNGSYIDSVALNASPAPQELSNVQPWDIAQAHFDSLTGPAAASISDTNSPYFASSANVNVNVDTPMYLAFGIQGQEDDTTDAPATPSAAYLDADTLQALAQSYFLQYSALIAHQALMQPAAIATTCTAYIGGDRLVVSIIAVQTVTVLLSIILLFNIVAICVVPGKGYLPRDPQSLLDVAALLSHSQPLLQALRGAGGADKRALRSRVKMSTYYTGVEPYDRGSAETGKGNFCIFSDVDHPEPEIRYTEPTSGWHHPFGLHPLQRVVMYVFLTGLFAGLEIALRISSRNDGFGTLETGTFKHFLWTLLPAFIVTCVAIFFATADFHVRALAPFAELTKPSGGSMANMISGLLDRTAPTAVYRAMRMGCYTVAGSSAAVVTATLLPIFAASVFTARTVPVSSEVQLITQDFFSNSTNPPLNSSATCPSCADGMTLASLVLDGNLSYPDFTFEDLAFPALAIVPLIGVNETDDLETTTTVPAVRSAMSCSYYAQKDIVVNLTTNYRIGGIVNPLRINLPGEPSLGSSELLSSTLVLGTAPPLTTFNSSNVTTSVRVPATSPAAASPAPIRSDAIFGVAAYRPFQAANGSLITHWVYAWGQLANANTNQTTVQTISALACNETMEQLDVQVAFDGATLDINPDLPLRRMEATVQPSDAALSTTLNYSLLGNTMTASPNLLDNFFGTLVSSRFGLPVATLGDGNSTSASGPGTQNNSVAEAILKQHGILRAQVVSAFNRRPTTASSRPAAVFPLDSNGTAMGNATQIGFTGHLTSVSDGTRRLLQDAPTTRVLQTLLGLVLVCSLLSWITFPGPSNVLPRPITSIASVAALLADGNVLGYFGRGPEWQTVDQLVEPFRDGLAVTAGFTLGWARAPLRRRQRQQQLQEYASSIWGVPDNAHDEELFGINAARTGGWGGGENVGLGLQARVGYAQRGYVANWAQQGK